MPPSSLQAYWSVNPPPLPDPQSSALSTTRVGTGTTDVRLILVACDHFASDMSPPPPSPRLCERREWGKVPVGWCRMVSSRHGGSRSVGFYPSHRFSRGILVGNGWWGVQLCCFARPLWVRQERLLLVPRLAHNEKLYRDREAHGEPQQSTWCAIRETQVLVPRLGTA